MNGKNDPFGGGKTVIIPSPGGTPKRDQSEPPPPIPGQQKPASPFSKSTAI